MSVQVIIYIVRLSTVLMPTTLIATAVIFACTLISTHQNRPAILGTTANIISHLLQFFINLLFCLHCWHFREFYSQILIPCRDYCSPYLLAISVAVLIPQLNEQCTECNMKKKVSNRVNYRMLVKMKKKINVRFIGIMLTQHKSHFMYILSTLLQKCQYDPNVLDTESIICISLCIYILKSTTRNGEM